MPRATARRPGTGSAIAVFGSAEPVPGSPEYEVAREVGRRLAAAGFAVVNGGYGGVMEASARGAREAGGRTIGVTTKVFTSRPAANAWIETEESTADLHDRTRRLIEGADGFIVLPGRSGTLSELTFLWALAKAGLLEGRRIVLLGPVWGRFLADLRRLDLVDREALAATRVAATPAAAVAALGLRREARAPTGAAAGGRGARSDRPRAGT
jgi:uncharacterized protein (TIGR00730 family)